MFLVLVLGAFVTLDAASFKVPVVYEADIQFLIPYIGLTESAYIFNDGNKGKMRLEYYSGMDTYIFSNTGFDYSIVPVDGNPTCLFSNSTGNDLTNIFPNMTKFVLQKELASITTPAFPNGVSCNVWQYNYGTETQDAQGAATSIQPDAEGYAGNYTFYTTLVGGVPVQFQIAGHNVVLGGSHDDLYIVNYLSVKIRQTISDQLLAQPGGMPCHPSSNPFGPTFRFGDKLSTLPAGVVRSNPLHDIRMSFPEGAAMREAKFAEFEAAHGKQYESAKERSQRRAIFHSNLRFINAANRRGLRFHVAANHLADRTEAERQQLMGFRHHSKTAHLRSNLAVDPLAACGTYTNSGNPQAQEVDWRNQCPPDSAPGCSGLVLPPKDQGTCGSCWSYGATGAIEAAWAKYSGSLVSLSEQNLIDCSWSFGSQGCGGSSDYLGYAWLLAFNNGSIASDASYSYNNQDGFCHFDLSTTPPNIVNPWTGDNTVVGASFSTCTHVTKQWNCTDNCVPTLEAVDTLNDALSQGNVLSVAIDATQPDFYFYHSGYYYSDQCKSGNQDLDHQVLAVGYTQGPDGLYTIVKNSWSTHWGEAGFIKISQQNNCCGVATQATFISV